MTSLLLLDVDQLSVDDRDALVCIMIIYGAIPIAVYPDGAMRLLVPSDLLSPFLATVARDALPAADFARWVLQSSQERL